MPSAPAGGPIAPIPLTVLTGFLGAGKTTLLNGLLRDPALADTLVIVNEFGEIGLDHQLIEAVEDGLVLLSAGCLCCTVRGDLVSTLEDLLRRRDNGRITPFRRVLIETTGLADPAPVLAAVLYHPYLSLRYAVAGVVTVVDAVHGAETLDRHVESVKQVAVADRIVVTKRDLLGKAEAAKFEALKMRLGELNPAAAIVEIAPGEVPAGVVTGSGLFSPDGKIADVREWLGAEAIADRDAHTHGAGHAHDHGGHAPAHDLNRHDARIHTFCLTSERPVPRGALDMFLDLVRSAHGPRLLRFKGLVGLSEDPDRPVVIQGVQHVLHVPAVLPAWPDGDRRSRLVFILDDVPREAIERLWGAFAGQPAIDQADAAALTDNPLSPPTMAR